MGLAFETIKTSFSSTDYNIMLNISSNNTDEIDEIDRFLGSIKTGFEEEDEDDF